MATYYIVTERVISATFNGLEDGSFDTSYVLEPGGVALEVWTDNLAGAMASCAERTQKKFSNEGVRLRDYLWPLEESSSIDPEHPALAAAHRALLEYKPRTCRTLRSWRRKGYPVPAGAPDRLYQTLLPLVFHWFYYVQTVEG